MRSFTSSIVQIISVVPPSYFQIYGHPYLPTCLSDVLGDSLVVFLAGLSSIIYNYSISSGISFLIYSKARFSIGAADETVNFSACIEDFNIAFFLAIRAVCLLLFCIHNL